MLFSATGCVFHHENTRRLTVGCYNGLKVCCFGDFERFVCNSIYCVSALSLHIESTDSMICGGSTCICAANCDSTNSSSEYIVSGIHGLS